MLTLELKPNLGGITLALDGKAPPASPNASTYAEVSWRWEDDVDMEPQPLLSVVAGHTGRVPFDLKGRSIRLFAVSKTSRGIPHVNSIREAEQIVFGTSVATLESLSFSSPNVTVTIANNAGTGDIHILRRTGSNDFAEVGSVSAVTTTFNDAPAINATYDYKLTQDGQEGESNTLSVVVTGAGGGAGTPPDSLSGTFDGVDTVTLTWTNHGGTGNNIVEVKRNSGGDWYEAGSVSSGTSTMDDTEFRESTNRTMYYRVHNENVTGYSNEFPVFIPRET